MLGVCVANSHYCVCVCVFVCYCVCVTFAKPMTLGQTPSSKVLESVCGYVCVAATTCILRAVHKYTHAFIQHFSTELALVDCIDVPLHLCQ